jgi:sugar O-acyltransferase (sialic acid O-acetyltransferase NeuD family)
MEKEKIIIVGCGEQARVTIDAIEDQDRYQIYGLVTNNDQELHQRVYGYEVICKDDDVQRLLSENADIKGYFLGVGVGTGSMARRFELYTWLDKLLEAINIISPQSVISKYSRMGKGNFIEAYARIANGVTIGNHCLIQSFTSINHDQTICDNVLIGCNVSMAGKRIGSHTTIADGSSIGFKKSVGENCLVTDGTVITKDLPDNVIAYGNPAKTMPRNNFMK